MTLRNSWPGPSGVTTTTDARINLGGLIDDFVSGTPRTGVFPSNLNAIVTARTDMNVDIAAFAGVANQFGGPILIANDGTIQLPSVLVSPASGANFYVVYVKQDESTSPGTDADNLPKAGAALSTVSFAAARALLPTGALELATVQVPTGVAATNAGGVTITQTFTYTTAEGGILPVRNSTELAAWTPADGSLSYQIDTKQLWTRQGGNWVPTSGLVPITPTGVTGGLSIGASGVITGSSIANTTCQIQGIFSAIFEDYLLIVEFTGKGTPGNTATVQGIQAAGGLVSSTNHFYQDVSSSGGAPAGSLSASQANFLSVFDCAGASTISAKVDIMSPFDSARGTHMMSNVIGRGGSTQLYTKNSSLDDTTSLSGLQITTNSTIGTVRIRVYGYAN